MGHSSKVRRSWEVFRSVDRPTFQWGDPRCLLESFDRVCPRPARPQSMVIPGRICPWLTNALVSRREALIHFRML
jgi:hypothetical protein